jgi:hypothetical protein
MKKFIKKSFFFVLPLILMLICMEILLRDIPNEYNFKKNYLDKKSPNIEILCLGSSHSYFGIDPAYFDKNSFNGSHVSQSLDYDLKILKKYQGRLDSLKYILIPISYFTLYSKLERGIEAWRVKNYSLYYNIRTCNSIKEHSEVLSNNTKINIGRIYSYYVKKQQIQIQISELGWGMTFSSKNQQDLVKTGNITAKRHTGMDDSLLNENIENMKSIIKLAKQNKSIVIFFTPPAYYTYRENLNPNQLEKTVNTVNKIVKDYDNTLYINYMHDKRFLKSDFYDADHLNEIGAEKLTKLLNNLINNIAKYGLYNSSVLDEDSAAPNIQ